jgi:hypothetical protein
MAAPPREGDAGKRKDQRHQNLVAARGAPARRADAVTTAIGVAIATSSHQRAARRARRAGEAEQHDEHLHDPPGRAAHRFADAGAPHPPHLAHGHRR